MFRALLTISRGFFIVWPLPETTISTGQLKTEHDFSWLLADFILHFIRYFPFLKQSLSKRLPHGKTHQNVPILLLTGLLCSVGSLICNLEKAWPNTRCGQKSIKHISNAGLIILFISTDNKIENYWTGSASSILVNYFALMLFAVLLLIVSSKLPWL
jgi:hypothetical protein